MLCLKIPFIEHTLHNRITEMESHWWLPSIRGGGGWWEGVRVVIKAHMKDSCSDRTVLYTEWSGLHKSIT